MPFPDNYALYYSLASAYEPPEILKRIGTDRSKPYTHYEKKRTRNRWRYHDELHGPVYKTTYVRKEYALGSDQGGVLQPIQQHSWDVTWSVPDPRGVQNTFFTNHPYSSVQEFQTYFVFSPNTGTESVVRSKKTYDSPDKFLGGSPYEKLFQDQDSLIALYDIAPETRFPHVNGFFFEGPNRKWWNTNRAGSSCALEIRLILRAGLCSHIRGSPYQGADGGYSVLT